MTELPKGWVTAQVGDLLQGITAGKNLKCEERPPEAHERGVIKVSAVTWGTFDASQAKTLPISYKPAQGTDIKAGDFLFSRANTLELVGAVVLVKSDHPNLFLSDKILRLDFPPELKPWLLVYLQSLEGRRKLGEVSSGNQMSMRNIGQSALRTVSLPLPPLPEQHRIVAKIEGLFSELDAGEASLTRARAQLALYRQSLLKAAFQGHLTADWRAANPDKLEPPETLLSRIRRERETRYRQALDDWQTALAEWRVGGEKGRKPGKPERPAEIELSDKNADIPSSWIHVLVEGLLSEPLSNGRSVKDKVGGFPVLRLTAFRNGRLDLTESKAGAWTVAEAAPWIVKEGDFFAARGNGSKHLVGIGALAVGVGTSVAYPDTMIRLAVDREIVDPEYFAAVWNSRVIRDQIESAARTTAGIYKINQPHICGFSFPLPPRGEQVVILERIIPVLSQIEHQEVEITTALARISALRQSILKKAFSGQLVPQDPSDEPASALLSRLRATAPTPKTRRKIPA